MIPFLLIRALAMPDYRLPDGRKARLGDKRGRWIRGVMMEDLVAGLRRASYEAAHGTHPVNGSLFKVFELIAEHIDAKAPKTPNRVTNFILSGDASNQEVPPPAQGLMKPRDPYDHFEEIPPA